MNLLVDTHALLWFLGGDAHLTSTARDAIEDRTNDVRVSVASLWEVTIKHSRGKLALTAGVEGLMHSAFVENGFERMQIEPEHLTKLSDLPYRPLPGGDEHRDPFDRLLVAQALAEGATLMTKETWWKDAYGVAVLW